MHISINLFFAEEWPYTASGFPSTAGTTVSCVFIRNGKLYTGHVGDSAIYLGTVENGGLRSRPLTIDHKPESAHEQIRIARAGGETAVKSGVTRVVWKRPSRLNSFQPKRPDAPIILDSIPFLSVARSLGDLWSYNEETNMFIVSPEPDLGVHRLTGNDFCLVLASDGMTNVLTGDQAISIVFKEEELVEIHEEINRNHSRCVLRSALQKWRSLRADNITVATVIFDIDPLSYTENEMLMKVGKYINASQVITVLTDRPEAMLKISKTDNILLTTQRTPILYNGSRDEQHFAARGVLYRGPGFRTHDEELQHERQRIGLKLGGGASSTIAIAPKGSIDSKRGPAIPSASSSDLGLRCRREEDDLVDYDYDEDEDDDEDDDEEDEEEDDGPFDPSEEISLKFTEKTITVTHASPNRPSRPHAPRPVFLDDSIVDEDSDGVQQSTSSDSSSSMTPSRTSEGVRRIKAEAVRRLRTPRIVTEDSEGSRRITRSASKASVMSPSKDSGAVTMTLLKTPTSSLIGLATSLTPDAAFGPPQTPRRSSRLLNYGVTTTPSKLTMSRKRGRTSDSDAPPTTSMMPMMTGVTPVVAGLSLQEHHHHQLSHQLGLSIQPLPSETPRLHFQSIFGCHSMEFPSQDTPITRSAPSTPKKSSQLKATTTKMTSLSALDEKKKKQKKKNQKIQKEDSEDDGVIRVSEVADEEEEDVMREPPSKIRRFYGYVRKIFWGK
ncbi:hypothetical protein CRE_19560 [Caenorhabditis remanei]|uniref:PPM-type phosphatase domain-containing protein n=1 Tax=Caenorhabditis remanei TaxID=31234 RepID=E3NLS8_CAERE|nr:hypothetical protein CRE_19560 [Caenorhabditis remanei]